MEIYYGLLVLVGIWTVLYLRYQQARMIFALLVTAVFIYISATRYKVGYDYGAYASMYQHHTSLPFDQLADLRPEKGFVFINFLLGILTKDYRLFFLMTSVLIIGGVFWYFWRKSAFEPISVFVFLVFGYYYISMNFVRQFLAAVIVLGSFHYWKQKDWLVYSVIIFLAMSFHLSAVMMFPAYYFLRLPLRKTTIAVTLIIASLLYMLSIPILTLLTSYMYTEYSPLSHPEMNQGIPFHYVISFLIVFILAYPQRRALYQQNPDSQWYLASLYWILLIEMLALKHAVLSRFILYFLIPGMCLLIPELIVLYRKRWFEHRKSAQTDHQIVYYAISILLLAATLGYHHYLLKENYNGVVPYQHYWERSENNLAG